jgi:hypothetical protein
LAADSSSAPDDAEVGHADAEARDKLRLEALSWGIAAAEISHILAHHDLDKARNILWTARRNAPPPVWEKVPA